MGAKDSKPSFISYEDAVKRVSDSELRRIREAFKRCAGANGTALSLEAFVHEVLCDGVPYEVAEWLYQACGGTKRGIAFRELLCGIVVLTKGNLEEKIKFLWTLYVNNQSDNGTYIYKRDFARALHLENTSLPISGVQRTAEVLTGLFGINERVTFEQFRSWLLIHKDATVLSKWLLSNCSHVTQDLETPTFYQSLAGVTHLEERDIIELEKCFWSLRNASATGELDAESLSALLSPPLPAAAVAGAFLAFDENRDGHVDFKELCCGLSAACRGPRTERLKFCFKIFDMDRDGVLNKKELIDMVGILCTVSNESKNQSSRSSTPSDGDSDGTDKGFDPDVILLNLRDKLVTVPKNGKKPMFQLGPSEGEDIIVLKEESKIEDDEGLISSSLALTLEDFLIWSVESAESVVTPFLDLVFEVCHIVLGLRPQCKHHERDIVLGWLRREVQRGYSVGQFWYLVGAEWWANWLAYTALGANTSCCRLAPRQVDEAVVCDESFTSNSTESMGSLLWRAETGSVGSAGSSGVSSVRGGGHPGPLDNRRLKAPPAHRPHQVRTLTGEGGHLRRDLTLAQHRDFELVPDALWRALALWYGAPDPLPRQVIRPPNSDVELELYPLELKLYRHIPNTQRANSVTSLGLGGVGGMGGMGGMGGVGGAGGAYSAVGVPQPPERQLAYTAAFSRLATVRQVLDFLCSALGLAREDVRLWALSGAGAGAGAEAGELLEDERVALHELRLGERARLLLEIRNPDLTWPEEIGALGSHLSGVSRERRDTLAPALPGATGLHNLGNTCFMNAALQAVWNTGPLTKYFNSGMHLYEINTSNPLGTRGVLALRYGELCKEVWSSSARSVAPLRVRWCVSRHARALAGGGQHDAQEFLAWLLDALHEDLNRAKSLADAPTPTPAPASTPTPASAAPPEPEQSAAATAAAAAWQQYEARNASIMTELFYGQLRSKVRCDTCARDSVRYDAFNMLSLPLPLECYVRHDVRVVLLDGSVPVKYGVRVNSESTYLDFKNQLAELCGLPPDTMLLAEVSGATISRVLEDNMRVGPVAGTLYVYQLPVDDEEEHRDSEWCAGLEEECEAASQPPPEGAPVPEGEDCQRAAEVSVPRGNTSSLCMPALFCFKSPPNTFYGNYNSHFTDNPTHGDYRSQTLPKELKMAVTNGKSSPTLSVKSLNLKSASPRLKVKFASSPSNMYRMNETYDVQPMGKIQYLVAVHRKQCRSDAYFLPSQRCRATLFGVPLVVGVREHMSGRELYAQIWARVARLLSARPPPLDRANHATDCDDSLGYEFPFTVRAVCASGAWCAVCAWPALCRGCALPSDTRPLLRGCVAGTCPPPQPDSEAPDPSSPAARAKLQRHAGKLSETGSEAGAGSLRELDLSCVRRGRKLLLAIDWDPTALHLRYQSTREKACRDHSSVSESAAASARPVDLGSCLAAFTSEERLEQRYHCATCRSAQPATKKLQIWRAPPVLIIHLKRFQYVNNKWIKSQKVVNFPFEDFDPTDYLASVPQETILRHRELRTRRKSTLVDVEAITESNDEGEETPRQESRRRQSEVKTRRRLESSSLAATPVSDDNLIDYHRHRLQSDQDPFDLKYRLYAVVCHSGQLSGGHYVAYARNPSGAWLCYNDSSCREVAGAGRTPNIDPAAAYLLFYERRGLRDAGYLPPPPASPPPSPPPDHDDADLRRACVIA